MEPMLQVKSLTKVYRRGLLNPRETFRLEADFAIEEPAIVGMMGPNGSGKTTLFELITGSNSPTSGSVTVRGRDIHRVRTDERDRLAIHYHQSYQVRSFRSLKPNALMERAGSDYPLVHLFDEPQFNTQDGYIGFMLDFFRKLRREGRLVFLCVHPNERFHLEIMKEICERFVFVQRGSVTPIADYDSLIAHEPCRAYLADLLTERAA
ncbi:ATP-binding cassette domain-containing protein [Nitratireductor mangrovi]|uniref:ATP-binding cassette domain-containing protein n=1 Tax=Nitratireductor mangrovi TaxID=2599600 RepID=A0A5B8KVY4_9HYPH|nr:ATP-binding cassette domain-containing protein [Nitratireductor mangrovi]QDY99715.1 ATP-binding cassette domain-containing protein [Nitratireductor mangrovi]